MSFLKKEISFPSSDGVHTVFGYAYIPETAEPKGILQVSHGMIDHIQRYQILAEYLTEKGYILAGNDHLGHGRTANGNDVDLGHFSDEGGIDFLLSDLKRMNEKLKEEFPSLPVFLMGHSMGSFLSRLYTEKYPQSIRGHIIHGTGGPMGAILPLGKALVKAISFFKGKRYRSKFVAGLAFSGYNKYFKKENSIYSWLTRDLPLVCHRGEDKFTSFIFTVTAYHDLFTMVGSSNSDKWFKNYPQNMKTLILSGDMDPVGNYGKGPSFVFKKLIENGSAETLIKLYPDARHELFNETCREEVFSDICSWMDEIIKSGDFHK